MYQVQIARKKYIYHQTVIDVTAFTWQYKVKIATRNKVLKTILKECIIY